MGNSPCCSTDLQMSSINYTGSEFATYIERNDLKSINNLLKSLPNLSLTINSEIIRIKNISISPICYALLTGQKLAFKFLYKKGSDLSSMDKSLANFKLNAIDILCERGYTDLLMFYLPIYLKNIQNSCESPEPVESTLNFASFFEPAAIYSSTPIQKACEKGHISVILYIYNYFKRKEFVPRIFDLNYPNEKTGEACALIACRKGDYAMLKVLHTHCKADLWAKNKYEENAVVVCVCAYRTDKRSVFLDCIKYLIEKAQLDISYMHEEILILSDCEMLTYYIEKQLEKREIYITKLEIDEKYKICRNMLTTDSFVSGVSTDFFSPSIRKYLELDSKSWLSSISQVSCRTDLICTSLLN